VRQFIESNNGDNTMSKPKGIVKEHLKAHPMCQRCRAALGGQKAPAN
jgi:hypothetical protein